MAGELYLEDLKPGDRFRSGAAVVTAERIVSFAREFDPQVFHLDHEAAKTTVFGGLSASGWHTASLTMRLFVGEALRMAGGAVGLGVDKLRWHKPVRPGDVLSAEVLILESRASKSLAGKGVIRIQVTTVNQAGETVLSMEAAALVNRRPTVF
ncbi:MAG: MaoC family dehydratase [Elusimicrobia bacterium]|nr:MaoC family dehydratase [Elusimicrobiota bacterium]